MGLLGKFFGGSRHPDKYAHVAVQAWQGLTIDIFRSMDEVAPDIPVDSIEVYVYTCFFICEAYHALKLKEHDKRTLDQVRDKISEKILEAAVALAYEGENQPSESDLMEFVEAFTKGLQRRYIQYRPVFADSLSEFLVSKKETLFGYNLAETFLGNAYIDKLPKEKTLSLIIPITIRMIQTFTFLNEKF
jgi:hypothetical protein